MEQTKTKRQVFTREEAYDDSLSYFGGDALAADAWINKYALKDSYNNIYESNPNQMHDRIADEIHRIESLYPNPLTRETIHEPLVNFSRIIPQGSPMAGIGNDMQKVSLSNCFVIGNELPADSYGAIFKTDQEQVQLMKRRGGVGHDLSSIRSAGSPVQNSALTSTGVPPFMDRYSNSTREVAQDGRRGALMLSISVQHPDSESFIDAKLEKGKVTGANISVRITDEFMEAILAGSPFLQSFPIADNLAEGQTPLHTSKIDAAKLWKKIIHNAWDSAEPGVLFWDKILSESLADCYADLGYRTISTNPCGEIPLCADDSCRLIAIVLSKYVKNPFTENATFDWDAFKADARTITRMMDDIVDLEIEKIKDIITKIEEDPEDDEIKEIELNLWKRILAKCQNGRRTGIGVTAEGDMLAMLGLTYGTPEATEFAESVHRTYAIEVFRSSNELAKERGAFPIWDPERELENPFLLRIKEHDPELYADLMKYGRRNIALLTIAPTGTVSLMAQTTSGIEPAFLVYYLRRRKINSNDKDAKVDFVDEVGDHWQEYFVFHPGFEQWINIVGKKFIPKDEADVPYNRLKTKTIDKLVKKSPYYKAMANDVDWVEKVKMQGKIQQWVDHSISVTVNLPEHVDEDLVNDVYITAWKSGCKGCTIYRDGSRSGVLVSADEKKTEEFFEEHNAPKRPKSLECTVTQFVNGGEKWIGFIGILEDRPYEIFTGKLENFPVPAWVKNGQITREKKNGQSNYTFSYMDKQDEVIQIPNLNNAFDREYYDMAKTLSAVLRHGMPLTYVISMIDSLKLDGDLINTWKSGVKRMIKKFIKDGTAVTNKVPEECPQPEENNCELVYEEGCLNCKTCGRSAC